jgi:hypothetical protein
VISTEYSQRIIAKHQPHRPKRKPEAPKLSPPQANIPPFSTVPTFERMLSVGGRIGMLTSPLRLRVTFLPGDFAGTLLGSWDFASQWIARVREAGGSGISQKAPSAPPFSPKQLHGECGGMVASLQTKIANGAWHRLRISQPSP